MRLRPFWPAPGRAREILRTPSNDVTLDVPELAPAQERAPERAPERLTARGDRWPSRIGERRRHLPARICLRAQLCADNRRRGRSGYVV